ncbi:FAD-dependent oxidoreductase [Actinomadura sp. HBU206391]|uniref:FAD-dependent oxidoreductase n=1 Tax=Actinomadura sp. HBU206391 TaxID=2731692 RepID=UPI001650D259|nr:FAD-dependent oxidoreductase [Actinomadura sp. HBU206391]MBC6456708.1 FAD-dependent oxidoreductase [Actinomadura sp. HBU206391]
MTDAPRFPSSTRPTVVVVGGGYAGISVAKSLDDIADVVLVEPKDAFVHNVAAMRALVDPDWLPRIFLPYDRLLTNGRVVRDRAARVEASRVVLASGAELAADYIVLATGSRYPFPAKTELNAAEKSWERYQSTHKALTDATRVLLLGAGAVGLELAGEILSVWPDKQVTITNGSSDILPGGYNPALRTELRRQLTELGVEFALGSPLRAAPPTPPGTLQTFTVTTEAGRDLTADLWFRCHGITPVTDYLDEELADALTSGGYLEVTSDLRVFDQDTVFAVGDIAAIDGNMARLAGIQAELAAANIRRLIEGDDVLAEYEPVPPSIIVPLGPVGGAGQFTGQPGVLPPEVVSQVKGQSMFVDHYAQILGVQPFGG